MMGCQERFFFLSLAFLLSSSREIGLAFSSNLPHNWSLSGPRNGFEKLDGNCRSLIFAMFKYTKSEMKNVTYALINHFAENSLKIKSRLAILASSVTYLPTSLKVKTTLMPLHLSVNPVTLNTGNSNMSKSSSQYECVHAITSSSSFGEGIPSLWRAVRLRWEWSYSIFLGNLQNNLKEPEEYQFPREIQENGAIKDFQLTNLILFQFL